MEHEGPHTAAALAEDSELVRLALGGEPKAVERLADRLEYVLVVLAGLNARRGRPLSDHDLEDLAQDVVIKIWRKLGTFNGRTTLESWFYGFCYLEMMNRMQSKSRVPPMGTHVEEVAAPAPPAPQEGDRPRDLLRHIQALRPGETEQYYRALKKLRDRLANLVPGGNT